MKLITKILISVLIWAVITTLYYYIYAYFQIWFKDLCNKNYCIEFLPYGDFLAAYIAIVGLYFVVTSLDAWKHQDQYQTAKNNIPDLLSLKDKFVGLCHKLNNIEKPYLENESKVLRFGDELETVKMHFEGYVYASKLKENIDIVIRKNTISNALFQEKFNIVTNLSHHIFYGISQDIKLIQRTQENKEGDYNDILIEIYNKYLCDINRFEKEVDYINDKIKSYISQ